MDDDEDVFGIRQCGVEGEGKERNACTWFCHVGRILPKFDGPGPNSMNLHRYQEFERNSRHGAATDSCWALRSWAQDCTHNET